MGNPKPTQVGQEYGRKRDGLERSLGVALVGLWVYARVCHPLPLPRPQLRPVFKRTELVLVRFSHVFRLYHQACNV